MIQALIEQLETLSDLRDPCEVEYRLLNILVIAVCAALDVA
jgi:hypothetical protein